jgi:hypothetical protein
MDDPIVYRRVSSAPFLADEERDTAPPPPSPNSTPVAVRRRRNKADLKPKPLNV